MVPCRVLASLLIMFAGICQADQVNSQGYDKADTPEIISVDANGFDDTPDVSWLTNYKGSGNSNVEVVKPVKAASYTFRRCRICNIRLSSRLSRTSQQQQIPLLSALGSAAKNIWVAALSGLTTRATTLFPTYSKWTFAPFTLWPTTTKQPLWTLASINVTPRTTTKRTVVTTKTTPEPTTTTPKPSISTPKPTSTTTITPKPTTTTPKPTTATTPKPTTTTPKLTTTTITPKPTTTTPKPTTATTPKRTTTTPKPTTTAPKPTTTNPKPTTTTIATPRQPTEATNSPNEVRTNSPAVFPQTTATAEPIFSPNKTELTKKTEATTTKAPLSEATTNPTKPSITIEPTFPPTETGSVETTENTTTKISVTITAAKPVPTTTEATTSTEKCHFEDRNPLCSRHVGKGVGACLQADIAKYCKQSCCSLGFS